jgi:cell division protein FtsL
MASAYADRSRAARGAERRASGPRAGAKRSAGSAGATRAGALPRVRWDRLGRMAMLVVLAVLLYLYLSAGLHMYSTWGQSRHDKAAVATLEREHRALASQHEALGRQNTVETEARQLGMKKANERQYVITGLPSN